MTFLNLYFSGMPDLLLLGHKMWIIVIIFLNLKLLKAATIDFTFHLFAYVFSPSEGSTLTPAHHFPDFRLKTYAPLAFRYFRELFGIKPDDYLVSVPSHSCSAQLSVMRHDGAESVTLNCSTPSATSPWLSCPTREPAAPGSTSPATTSSSSRRCSTRRPSSCRSCCLVITWLVRELCWESELRMKDVGQCRKRRFVAKCLKTASKCNKFLFHTLLHEELWISFAKNWFFLI